MYLLHTLTLLLSAGAVLAVHTCPADPGLSMNLDQDIGQWYMVAGSPVAGNKMSNCSKFDVTKVNDDEFTMDFTATSHISNRTVTFDIRGIIGENGIAATWKLRGSRRTLGPLWHIVIFSDEEYIITVVCSDDFIPYVPNGKFSMIWSRKRHPPAESLLDLKTKLAEYIDKDKILDVVQQNC